MRGFFYMDHLFHMSHVLSLISLTVTSIVENVEAMKERYPAYERISAVLRTISEV